MKVFQPKSLLIAAAMTFGALQPALDLPGHLEQGHQLPGPGRALHLELVAVEGIQIQEAPDDEHVDRHPDRAAPVGVPAEHSGVRFRGQIRHLVLLVPDPVREGMLQVELRQGPDPVRAQELVLVEQVGEHPRQLVLVEEGQEPPPSISDDQNCSMSFVPSL